MSTIDWDLVRDYSQRGALDSLLDSIPKERWHDENPTNPIRWTLLHYACFTNNPRAVVRLIDHGLNAIWTDYPLETFTPLALTFVNGSYESYKALLRCGADPNAPCDWRGGTIAHEAANSGNWRALEMMCSFGVNINHKTRSGYSPLIMSVILAQSSDIYRHCARILIANGVRLSN